MFSMKIFNLIVIVIVLASCSIGQDKSGQIEQMEDNAKIAQERANRMGQLPGTPENQEAINRGNSEAQRYRNDAREVKEDSWLVVLTDILMGR